MTPIFIFSMPRSGSTLLQRLIMSSGDVASVAEPWILLPLVYMNRGTGTLSEYSSSTCAAAIEDFASHFPDGISTYERCIREFVLALYREAMSSESRYFLDKTPRYYLIIPEIVRIFPDAKFIFLFRNPVDVYASIVSTWGGGGFGRIWRSAVDLERGPTLLAEGFEYLRSSAFSLQYENLVQEPEKQIKALFDYLELPFNSRLVSNLLIDPPTGRMGDNTGRDRYTTVSSKSVGAWQRVFDTSFRKRVLLRYVESIPEEVLNVHGYGKSTIMAAIRSHEVRKVGSLADLYFFYQSRTIQLTHANLFLSRSARWSRGTCLS